MTIAIPALNNYYDIMYILKVFNKLKDYINVITLLIHLK